MDWQKFLTKQRTTGLRDVTSGITSSAEHVSGRLLVRRTDGEVTIILDDLVLGASGTNTFYRLPSGMRPLHTRRDSWWRPNSASQDTGGTVNISTGGYVVGYRLDPGEPMTARIVLDTMQDWPSTYPGIEVHH